MSKKISDEYTLFKIIRESLTVDYNEDILLSSKDFDDCALIKMDEEYSMAITSDFIRGSGFYLFELGYLNYFDVGYYLIGANLSDIASMGAKPIGINTVVRYSKKMDDNKFRLVFEGMNSICLKYNVPIIGGDIGGHSSDVFSATAFGKIKTKNVLKRKNIGDNHVLCVTGIIGNAISALTYLKDIKPSNPFLTNKEEEYLLRSWKKVNPRIKEGILLSDNFKNVGCQDISDGLKATILQMSALTNKTFTIYEEKIPISKETKKIANYLNIDTCQLAFSASVDFELLISIDSEQLKEAVKIFNQNNMTLFPIGNVNKKGKNELIRNNGLSTEIPGVAWKQQSNDFIKEIIK